MNDYLRRHTDKDMRTQGDRLILTTACIVICVFAAIGVASIIQPRTCHHAAEEALDK